MVTGSGMRKLGRGNWPASVAVGLIALVVFLLLPQLTLHGMDADYFIVWLEQGELDYERHVAYLHLCSLLYQWMSGPGAALRALLLASALGGALGLVMVHRAMRILVRSATPGSCAAPAWLLAVGVGLVPSWFYFSTCAEIPGVFLLGAGLAWWAFAAWVERPVAWRAVSLGAACATAGAVHSFGHALSPTFAVSALVLGLPQVAQLTWSTRWRQVGLLVSGQLVTAVLWAWLWTGGAGGQAGDAVYHLEERWATLEVRSGPGVFLHEWLLPYAPWSVLALLAWLLPRSRGWASVVLVGLCVHMPISILLLGHYRIHEFGAYQVALAPAAVLATAGLLGSLRTLGIVVLLSGLASIWSVHHNWAAPVSSGFVEGVSRLHDARPFFLVVGRKHELDGARSAVSGLVCVHVERALGFYLLPENEGRTLSEYWDAWLGSLSAQGLTVLLSDSAQRYLADSQLPELRSLWRDHVMIHYQVTPVQEGDFRGVFVLRP